MVSTNFSAIPRIVSSLFGNALSLSAHEHINIQAIIIQKYRITSMADQIYLLTDFYHSIL